MSKPTLQNKSTNHDYLKHIYKAVKYYQTGGAQNLLYYMTSQPIRDLVRPTQDLAKQAILTELNNNGILTAGGIWGGSLDEHKQKILFATKNNLNYLLGRFAPWVHVFLLISSDSNEYIDIPTQYNNQVQLLKGQVDNIIANHTYQIPAPTVSLYLNNQMSFNDMKFKRYLMNQFEQSFSTTYNFDEKIFYSVLHLLSSRLTFQVKNGTIPTQNVTSLNNYSTDSVVPIRRVLSYDTNGNPIFFEPDVKIRTTPITYANPMDYFRRPYGYSLTISDGRSSESFRPNYDDIMIPPVIYVKPRRY